MLTPREAHRSQRASRRVWTRLWTKAWTWLMSQSRVCALYSLREHKKNIESPPEPRGGRRARPRGNRGIFTVFSSRDILHGTSCRGLFNWCVNFARRHGHTRGSHAPWRERD